MKRPHTHCPDCGAKLPDGEFPKRCAGCEAMHFLNPAPVAVLVQPVDGGVLTVRRAIDPGRGELALPGGFVDVNETWTAAAARELNEETGLVIDADDVKVRDVISAPDGTVLIFGIAPEVERSAVADFEPSREVSELAIVEQPCELAFPLHTEVLAGWFAT